MEQKGKTWKEEEEEATDGGDKATIGKPLNENRRRGKVGKE